MVTTRSQVKSKEPAMAATGPAPAPMESCVAEFGAGALWAIAQAFALSVPSMFGVHEAFALPPLVAAIVLFQLVLYSQGAPSAAVQLGEYASQVKPQGVRQALMTVGATMAGSVVGSVFARDALTWFDIPLQGIRPPISFFPQHGAALVLAVEGATSLAMCALSITLVPKHMVAGLLGLFVAPVPATILGVPGIDPAWSLGRAYAAKHFDEVLLYLLGPFAGAAAFGVAYQIAASRRSTKTKVKRT